MPRWVRHLYFLLLLLAFAGCAGSCNSCASCGVTPLPAGFPAAQRVENSTSVRVTPTGLQFLSDHIADLAPGLLGTGTANAGVVTFDVPKSTFSVLIDIDVCPDGPKHSATPPECMVEADLGRANLAITTAAPHDIKVSGTLAVRLQKLPLKGGCVCLPLVGCACLVDTELALSNNADCNNRDFADIPVDVDVSIETDRDATHGSRTGTSKVKIKNVTFDQNALVDNMVACGGGIDAAAINSLKGPLGGSLIGGLTGTLQTTLDDQLCIKEDAVTGVTCPAGSTADATTKVCKFSDGSCVGTSLGTDGKINLGTALAGLSPGVRANLDFMAALGGPTARNDGTDCDGQPCSYGDLNPINAGMTIGMLGGAEADPPTTCVPIASSTLPTGIPIPDELTMTDAELTTRLSWPDDPATTGADAPAVGIALNERYLNHLLTGVYNSGAICLGVGSSLFGSLLNSNTVSVLMSSMKDLGRQQKAAPLAMVLRPQTPPSAEIGNGTDVATDPLLKITLKKLFIDFYVFSNDRYLRAFTASFDLVIPVNLDVTADGKLAPVIDKLSISNADLPNHDMIREDPKKSASALADIVGGQIGSALGGAIAPIDLGGFTASLGIAIDVPPTVPGQGSPGLVKLEKGSDRFLGIFAGFRIAPPAGADYLAPQESETRADLLGKSVDAAGLVIDTMTADNRPVVEIRAVSPLDTGSRPMEYQYRLDHGFWHPYTRSRVLRLTDPVLALQMKHQVEVRSRVVGQPWTADRTPAEVEVIIDKTPPSVVLRRATGAGQVDVEVRDLVSDRGDVQLRWALGDGAFGEWQAASDGLRIAAGEAASLRVEARDQEGNVGAASQALVRGRPDKSLQTGSSTCNCTVPGHSNPGLALFGLFGLGAVLGLKRRAARAVRRRVAVASSFAAMAVGASFSGCSCSGDDSTDHKAEGDAGHVGCPDDTGNCETLDQGLIGSYSSVAVASDGTLWVAGYSDLGYGTIGEFTSTYLWGDLVVGKVVDGKVAWKPVDGLPEVDPTYDPGTSGGPADPFVSDVNGYRGGLTDAGDDVGMWTSVQLDVAGAIDVAYYDASHQALKFAQSADEGASWQVHIVQTAAKSDLGRYAKLLIVGGKPVIAYLAIEASDPSASMAKTTVRVASAKSATPGATKDWSFEDAAVDGASPCRAAVCASGTECRADTGKCQKAATTCTPNCGTGSKCFDDGTTALCAATLTKSSVEDYPEASGLYIALASTSEGLGIAYYDRIHGNLMAVRQKAGKWQAPLLVDGQDNTDPAAPRDTGDVGIGTSLFVDSSDDWHLAYANGFDESLMYVKLTGGATLAAPPEVADNGVQSDGQGIVGDDSSIEVTAAGEVHIAHGDSTHGKVRWTVGTAGNWTTKEVAIGGFAGAFNHVVSGTGGTQVMTWWRKAQPKISVGEVTFVKP